MGKASEPLSGVLDTPFHLHKGGRGGRREANGRGLGQGSVFLMAGAGGGRAEWWGVVVVLRLQVAPEEGPVYAWCRRAALGVALCPF